MYIIRMTSSKKKIHNKKYKTRSKVLERGKQERGPEIKASLFVQLLNCVQLFVTP